MFKLFSKIIPNEKGATAIEYALIAAIVGVALIAVLSQFSQALVEVFTMLGEKLSATIPAT